MNYFSLSVWKQGLVEATRIQETGFYCMRGLKLASTEQVLFGDNGFER